MATCPNCGKEMPVTAPVCPHCGYDFPLQPKTAPPKRGLAYSGLSDAALVVGQFMSVLGSVLSLVGAIASLLGGELRGAIAGVISSLVLLALYVVFVRVGELE